jgi:hypothetical protein
MNEHDEIEERLAAELIEELAPESGAGEPLETEVRRAFRETLGLLPYALEPRAPSAEVRRRLLAEIGRTAGKERPAPPVPLRRAAVGRRAMTWTLPLAASLALALAGVVAWQQLRLGNQRQAITSFEQQLRVAGSQEAELREARAMLAHRQEQLAMLTEPGAEFCMLRPYGELPQFPRARATMVLAADHQRWFLRGERLDPCELGRAYKIWFETESGPVAGPSFRVDGPNANIEVTARSMPEGILAISVTLEHDPNCELPEGPQVLRAERPIRLL